MKPFKIIILFCIMFFSISGFAQEDEKSPKDSTKTGYNLGKIQLPNPKSIESKYTYDPLTDRYIYTESVGDFSINYPIILTREEYQKLITQKNLQSYYKQKIDAYDGRKEGAEDAQKNLLPEFYVNSGFFESIFGGNTIEVIPQGSVEMDLGVIFTRNDNPSFSPRNRRNFTFDFDQRISINLLGKVGTRLQVNANYDTQSTFDFQNIIKLEYTPTDDDIIRKIEVGNVSMPLNSSLIKGAQSLFGVKTELQFGKTRVTAVYSEQKSETKSVVAQGGGTLEEFNVFAREYDQNRHYFLAHYFRDNYDRALESYPYLNTNVQITRIEVWVTNRVNKTDNVRNIVAVQDLGESKPENISSTVPVSAGPFAYADNSNNGFNPEAIGSGSVLTGAIRDIATVQTGFGSLSSQVNEGVDYVTLEGARKLTQGTEFTLNTQLGYISLNQRLNNDEILAVAFQYTVGDQVFQVGEFANDGVEATNVTVDGNGVVTSLNNQNLVVKMLKSTITNVEEPVWDLMMKNIYDTGAYQLGQQDFTFNIFYTETSPLNYITPVGITPFPDQGGNTPIEEIPLLRFFNFDKLNYNNDPQEGGDGFFDFVSGITVIPEYGKIIFTKVEPFGAYLFDRLSLGGEDYDVQSTYNENQKKYVYNELYKLTKTAALEYYEKNKFQLKGRYKSSGSDGISIGAFNVPRGSVKVTAGGRILVEGIDYTVNYQLGRVQILDPALKASNTPINVTVENNSFFGQQTKRFAGVNVEHQFNKNFVLGATFLNLNEKPITQKANYGTEPTNNTVFGFNGNYSTEVPFLTRMVNKLPNIDTDVPSNVSIRAEFAKLIPGTPKRTDFNGEATSYIDDFEGTQNSIDLRAPLSWFLSSTPVDPNLGYTVGSDPQDQAYLQNGYYRSRLNWYTIDPIFYTNQKPNGISNDDLSTAYTHRFLINDLFPDIDLVQGQNALLNTLDLAYYPDERGPYNFNTNFNSLSPQQTWAGITRSLTTNDFEQANVEYIEFWLLDPFLNNTTNPGGKLILNLGNISEDILKDGRKQYENGLPDGSANNDITNETAWGIVPANQSLIYAFDTTGDARTKQDVGYDGLSDADELTKFGTAFGPDPANDNYQYYLDAEGDIFERYRKYNGVDGNSPEQVTDTNRGRITEPDSEDLNRDNTMNTIDSYFEYEIPITPTSLDISNTYIKDVTQTTVTYANDNTQTLKWYQFRIPVTEFNQAVNGIADFRSIRFMRVYLKEFQQPVVLRFGTFELVRGDWRRYQLTLQANQDNPDDDGTNFETGVVSLQDNPDSYVRPPGVQQEQLYNNNTVVDQNEQALTISVCDLENEDSRAVYKNINVDMRQFKKLRMFLHAESNSETSRLSDTDLVAFIRMGNDHAENYYQVELPLKVSQTPSTSANEVWPSENEITLPIDLLQKIKAIGISNGTLNDLNPHFYNTDLVEVSEFDGRSLGELRLAVKGNPNFGDIRTLMVGVKNTSGSDACGTVWFNELRLSDMDNQGGWAAVTSLDGNIADFANVSATGRISTIGFGGVEERPNERSREDVKQYDVVTNINLGQLLPKKWGVQIPFNFGVGEELITPEYDQQYKDIKLKNRLKAATSNGEKERIKQQSEQYTKRKSINFIGVKKNKTNDTKPKFYDIENVTFNYSYNEVKHRDYEIENALEQNVRVGANYNYNFEQIKVEPFKKNDSLFRGEYWKILKDFNFNLLPTSFSLNTDIVRMFNKQKFRQIDLSEDNIQAPELFRRNYVFNTQFIINYNLTESLRLNFSANNNNIVKNYFLNDSDIQNPELGVWDGFFDVGDPNIQAQQLGVSYDIPINKIPTFSFIDATYVYTGNFQWAKGSDLYQNLEIEDTNGVTRTYNLGNSIQNSSVHNLTGVLDMTKLYKYIGFVRKSTSRSKTPTDRLTSKTGNNNQKKPDTKKNSTGRKVYNTAVDVLTSLKRVQFNYTENSGTFLPGYMPTPGFIGTLKPTLGFTFGSQSDVRYMAARKGWLTIYDQFNQQYTQNETKQFNYSASVEPMSDLQIDLVGNRMYAENTTENFYAEDLNGDGLSDVYNPLIQNSYGNFNISTVLLGTSFMKSDEFTSKAFNDFRANRLVVANRLAQKYYGATNYPVDSDGYPVGFGKTNQAVLLPAFLSAYSGKNANKSSLSAFKDFPVPNWTVKYTGLMRLKWFKKNFKRFSLSHGYRANYTINQFSSNLQGIQALDNANPNDDFDTNGNVYNRTLYSNLSLSEMFSPLIKVDFEMKNSIKILAELKKDRLLSLSFDNNLLTEVLGNEYVLGLGYRIKDVRIRSKLAGPKQSIVSDLNLKADVSLRDNKTVIRYLDLENNQVTAGQTIWGVNFTADYAFSKNLSSIFYFDYTFSEYAISTAFPQSTLRTGITVRYNFGN